MQVTMTGATGFLGSAVVAALRQRGDRVTVLTRDPARAEEILGREVECLPWNSAAAKGAWEERLCWSDAVLHLAGEPVMSHRWSPEVRAAIRDSRVMGTRSLVRAMQFGSRRPGVFVTASGVDYYGDTGDRTCDEHAPAGSGFLPEVCRAWEGEAQPLVSDGVRVCAVRIGVVLGEGGGALERMLLPFRMYAGGPIGEGNPWMSWISREDIVRVFLRALDDAAMPSAVNGVAPEPVQMDAFAARLGAVLGKPSWLRVPDSVLRLAVGEGADVLLASKRVVPGALKAARFAWKQPGLEDALRAALGPLAKH